MFNNNNASTTNVNPLKWGPLFWALLHTIAQYSGCYPNIMNSDLSLFVAAIPDVLPCNECSNHCKEIYSKLNLINSVSLTNYKRWVYTLRSEINKYTNSQNINYENYLSKLKQTRIFITKKQLIDLLAMISVNYPDENNKESQIRRNNIFIFVQQLIKFVIFIPHLASIGRFIPLHVWKNKKEFQRWVKFNCQKVYRYNVTFNYS